MHIVALILGAFWMSCSVSLFRDYLAYRTGGATAFSPSVAAYCSLGTALLAVVCFVSAATA